MMILHNYTNTCHHSGYWLVVALTVTVAVTVLTDAFMLKGVKEVRGERRGGWRLGLVFSTVSDIANQLCIGM